MLTTLAAHRMRVGHHRGAFPGPGLYRATCGCGWKTSASYGASGGHLHADAIETIRLTLAAGTNTACCICAEVSADLIGHGVSRHGGRLHDVGDGGVCRTCGFGGLVLPSDLVVRSTEQGHQHGLFEVCDPACARLPVDLTVEVLIAQKAVARC